MNLKTNRRRYRLTEKNEIIDKYIIAENKD